MTKKIIPIAICSLALLALGLPAARGVLAGSITTFTVNSTLDEVDNHVGDHLCHTANNTCTLRAAIMEADQVGATIVLPAGLYTLTIHPAGLNPNPGPAT